MLFWIPWIIAIISTTAFLALWFWEVCRILRSRKSVVECAAAQLAFNRKNAGGRDEHTSMEVLKRSERIYWQAVAHYNDTLQKPWIYLPALLMGFRQV